MTSLSSRNRANKRKGAQFEVDVLNYTREQGVSTERPARTGRDDEGDLVLTFAMDRVAVLEAKNVATPDMKAWLAEARTEADNWQNRRRHNYPVLHGVITKTRQAGVNKARITFDYDVWLEWEKNRGR